MDSTKRLISKAVTWQIAGLICMTGVGYVFTGSVSAGGGIAIVGAAVGFGSYFVHELVWAKVKWGRRTENQ